jgi:hypothetical protein
LRRARIVASHHSTNAVAEGDQPLRVLGHEASRPCRPIRETPLADFGFKTALKPAQSAVEGRSYIPSNSLAGVYALMKGWRSEAHTPSRLAEVYLQIISRKEKLPFLKNLPILTEGDGLDDARY